MKRLQLIVSLLLGLLLVAQVHAGNDTRQLSLEEGSAKRVALVIGNDSYQHVDPLKNAVSDARAIAAALQKAGFSVTFKANTDLAAMKQAVRQFKGNLSGGDEAIFYYSGHGVQLGNANYLLPVDITSDSEEQVKDDAIPLQRLLDDLQDQKVKFALAIIDACRDNPFKGTGRNIGTRGLAPTSAANGQMVIFSAGAGQQALDKLGGSDHEENGVFTRVFLQEMQKPNIEVHQVLRNVRTRVVQMAKSINHDQMPALYDQVEGDFYFYGSSNQVASLEPVAAPVAAPAGGKFSLDDIKKQQEARGQWDKWQANMKADFDQTAGFTGAPELQVAAWERFLANYAQDNPYSAEDKQLRAQAQSRKQAARPATNYTTQQATTPKGFVSQGGLTWMPVTFYKPWAEANAYCNNTAINGQTGWRLPTKDELKALYDSGAMKGQGWMLTFTRSSTPIDARRHYVVYLDRGNVSVNDDILYGYVTCVR